LVRAQGDLVVVREIAYYHDACVQTLDTDMRVEKYHHRLDCAVREARVVSVEYLSDFRLVLHVVDDVVHDVHQCVVGVDVVVRSAVSLLQEYRF
jgi:hypothetical protein